MNAFRCCALSIRGYHLHEQEDHLALVCRFVTFVFVLLMNLCRSVRFDVPEIIIFVSLLFFTTNIFYISLKIRLSRYTSSVGIIS